MKKLLFIWALVATVLFVCGVLTTSMMVMVINRQQIEIKELGILYGQCLNDELKRPDLLIKK